nr:MAG TPA: hypothetical protein [Caudoviricetes sp.]
MCVETTYHLLIFSKLSIKELLARELTLASRLGLS